MNTTNPCCCKSVSNSHPTEYDKPILDAALGLHIQLEDLTHFGCIDMTVLFHGQVFLFEFKVVKGRSRGGALKQIKERNYAQKYQHRGEPIHQIGVEFSKTIRNIVKFEVETLQVL